MKRFKDFGIKPELQNFVGAKIHIERVLNREIEVHDFKIEDSQYQKKGGEKCLYLQITVDGEKRVLFSGSRSLMHAIDNVPKSDFPFLTTIIKDNQRLEFT